MPSGRQSAPESLRLAIEQRLEAAWIIDVARARLVAASPAGARLLGLAAMGAGASLDAAMPGLVRLRALSAGLAPGAETVADLVWWTPAGAVRQACRVWRPEGTDLIVVAAIEARVAGAAEPPPPAADDRATLRKIAARILNGRLAVKAPQSSTEGAAGLAREENDMARTFETPSSPGSETDGHAEEAAVSIIRAAPAGDPPRPSSPQERAEKAPQAAAADKAGPAADTPASDVLKPEALAEPRSDVAPELRARLAHELKSPLSAIVAAAEIMKDERLGPMTNARYRDYATDMHASARHALSLIDRMLTEARRNTEARPLDFLELDLNALVRETAQSFAAMAEKSGLALALDLTEVSLRLTADPVSLRQMLSNLIANAVKFTPHGGRVEIATRTDAKGQIRLVVTNTGIAISHEEAAGTAPAEARRGGGLGFGLPLVRELAAANGATFSIEADGDGGTRAELDFVPNRLILI